MTTAEPTWLYAGDATGAEPVARLTDAELAELEAEALAAGFDGMTTPTDEELPVALADAATARRNLAEQAERTTRPLTADEREQVRQIETVGILHRLGARLLADVPADPPAPKLLDRLDPLGHTILFGTGGSGKGTLATSWIAGLVREGHRVLVLDYENHPDEWARRYRGLAGLDGAERILWAGPLTSTWTGRRGALWRQAEAIAELVAAWNVTYIVVDSIVPACGGSDPMDPGTVARYTGALEYLGIPALSLAHVTKAESLAYPFGSVFWHNLSRLTWSLAKDGPNVILANRKSNNYASAGRFLVRVTYRDEIPREVWEQGYSAALAERIDDALGTDRLTVAQIVARLAEDLEEGEAAPKDDSVRAALRRGLKKTTPPRYAVDGTGSQACWSRAAAS